MSGFSCRAVMVVALATNAAPAATQSLADAAKRAGEQRKEVEGEPKTIITFSRHTFIEVSLTAALIDRYAKARSGLASLWKRNRPLYERVRDGMLASRTVRDLERAIENEATVVDTLKFYELTPESFVATEMTLRRAQMRVDGDESGRDGKVERENTAFVRVNATKLAYARKSWYLQEAGLSIFPP